MVNQTLLELEMRCNEIVDHGITAIAGSLNNTNIALLDVSECGIGIVGVRSLAVTLLSNQNIRMLGLYDNPITVDGACLIMNSAVDNGVCEYVGIDNEYADNAVKKMRSILDDRSRRDVRNLFYML